MTKRNPGVKHFLLFSILVLVSCGTQPSPAGSAAPLKLVASTTIVGDVVRQVAGVEVDLTILAPPGADPHTFEPRPQDIAAISEADLVFINGLGLEETLRPALDANLGGNLVDLSDGIEVRSLDGTLEPHEAADHEHEAGDPHVWMDPNNVIVWVRNIAAALSQADSANASLYRRNAETYTAALQELDSWIRTQVVLIPPGGRSLVSDHAVFGYFAVAYGFEQVGMIVPSLSTSAAPSAQELAGLEDDIRAQGVRAIFTSTSVNPTLARQVAADTGAQVVFIYTGSLSETGAEAGSYLAFMRYNVTAIVKALK